VAEQVAAAAIHTVLHQDEIGILEKLKKQANTT
jgi:hypothetical protein